MKYELHHGDCREVMATMPDNSVDAIVTDPPYGLSFMGKGWDHGVPGEEFWAEALRVAKPGAHLLAFGGTRTFHRLACAIEDAGWEIRDCVMWVYGSGFPKSANVSKMLDKQERDKWLELCKAIDNMAKVSILEAWQEYSSNAKSAGLTFQKSTTEIGMSTPKSGSAHALVAQPTSQGKSIASAITAELTSCAALHTTGENWSFAPLLASVAITELSDLVSIADSQPESQEAPPSTEVSSAPLPAWVLQSERITDSLKADEALKIWLGSGKSSKAAATSALCAALTDDLKRIILSQSETFLSLDTMQQTGFVSATTATITASTAESLISFTAGILKSKAIDKAAGAEREVVGTRVDISLGKGFGANMRDDNWTPPLNLDDARLSITAPATEAAKQWSGWGTALKPAWEPVIVARKPLVGTVATNVLEYGTGAINVDACRVGTRMENESGWSKTGSKASENRSMSGANYDREPKKEVGIGRWPANIIHDGSDEVLALFPVTKSGNVKPYQRVNRSGWTGPTSETSIFERDGDSGSAARFFYCAKASKRDRDEGCEGLPPRQKVFNGQSDSPAGKATGSVEDKFSTQPARNYHPTVKPTDLMRYLCRLVTPPDGVILDPFMGSGSTGKAALLEGFRFIGIEREAEYLEIARARIEAVVLPLIV